jgi:hypothetical protein
LADSTLEGLFLLRMAFWTDGWEFLITTSYRYKWKKASNNSCNVVGKCLLAN